MVFRAIRHALRLFVLFFATGDFDFEVVLMTGCGCGKTEGVVMGVAMFVGVKGPGGGGGRLFLATMTGMGPVGGVAEAVAGTKVGGVGGRGEGAGRFGGIFALDFLAFGDALPFVLPFDSWARSCFGGNTLFVPPTPLDLTSILLLAASSCTLFMALTIASCDC